MRRLVVVAAFVACAGMVGYTADAAPAPAPAPETAAGHSHQHTDCLWWAQQLINEVNPGGEIDEWPWFLTGYRTPFLFYGDTHTTCELKNVYYGYPDYTCIILNIDHTPVDSGTHEWAYYECGDFLLSGEGEPGFS